MVKRLAAVLDVPAAYLYAEDDDLAEAVAILGALSSEKRRRLIEELRKLSAESS